ncbi:MAG: ABC transporter permease [Chloroflexi bacterium]|nr:MAG: ABC transporter permease [Chloroflexota bacterium]
MSLRKIWAVLVKELRHIWRDPATLVLLLLAPVLLMVIMSYALIADVRRVPITVLDYSQSTLSRRLLATLASSEDIRIDRVAANYAEAERYFDRSQTKALLVIPPDFADRLHRGQVTEVQIVVDGTDPTTAEHVIEHVVSRSQAFGLNFALKTVQRRTSMAAIQNAPWIDLRTRIWYNPGLKNSHGIVPAMIPIALSLPAIVVINAIVREKEYGTLETIFSTPLTRSELIIGKLIPYVFTGLVSTLLCAYVAVLLFNMPFRGSLVLFTLLSTAFLLASFSMGLFLATFISSQQVAAILGLLVFMFPGFFLSGIFYPIASFPAEVQQEAKSLPSTHFVAIVRGLMVKGQGITALYEPALMLVVLTLAMTTLAVVFFKKRIR